MGMWAVGCRAGLSSSCHTLKTPLFIFWSSRLMGLVGYTEPEGRQGLVCLQDSIICQSGAVLRCLIGKLAEHMDQ